MCLSLRSIRLSVSVCLSYLFQDGLPLLTVGDSRQLHVSHLLHLLVHVDLLLEFLDLGSDESYRVVTVMLAGDGRGAGRMDGGDPVLQFCLPGRLNTTQRRSDGSDGSESWVGTNDRINNVERNSSTIKNAPVSLFNLYFHINVCCVRVFLCKYCGRVIKTS